MTTPSPHYRSSRFRVTARRSSLSPESASLFNIPLIPGRPGRAMPEGLRRGQPADVLPFSRLSPPLVDLCRFIAFSTLRDHLGQVRSFVRYLKPEFLDEVSESCTLEDD